MGHFVSVERNSYFKVMLAEKLRDVFGNANAIRYDPL